MSEQNLEKKIWGPTGGQPPEKKILKLIFRNYFKSLIFAHESKIFLLC